MTLQKLRLDRWTSRNGIRQLDFENHYFRHYPAKEIADYPDIVAVREGLRDAKLIVGFANFNTSYRCTEPGHKGYYLSMKYCRLLVNWLSGDAMGSCMYVDNSFSMNGENIDMVKFVHEAIVIPEAAWNVLVQAFGGGPEISMKTMLFEGRVECDNIVFMTVAVRGVANDIKCYFNRFQTMGQIKAEICTIIGIDEEEAHLHHCMRGTPIRRLDVPESMDSIVNHELLATYPTLFLDVLQDDGFSLAYNADWDGKFQIQVGDDASAAEAPSRSDVKVTGMALYSSDFSEKNLVKLQNLFSEDLNGFRMMFKTEASEVYANMKLLMSKLRTCQNVKIMELKIFNAWNHLSGYLLQRRLSPRMEIVRIDATFMTRRNFSLLMKARSLRHFPELQVVSVTSESYIAGSLLYGKKLRPESSNSNVMAFVASETNSSFMESFGGFNITTANGNRSAIKYNLAFAEKNDFNLRMEIFNTPKQDFEYWKSLHSAAQILLK